MRLYGVAGWKNSGKTGLVERLVHAFSGQGLRVATLKHAHKDFDIDHEGTDSFRHRKAGAGQVLIASPRRVALMTELAGPEPGLDDLLARLDPCDLVLIEGWKRSPHPKIETVLKGATQPPLAASDPTVRAVASNTSLPAGCPKDRPVLDIDDTAAIAAFIARDLGL